MKLLYCKKCRAIFNLNLVQKKCECGLTKGIYLDELYAIYTGRNAMPIGIDNVSFGLQMWPEEKLSVAEIIYKDQELNGKYFKAWFIKKKDCCDTFIKVTKKEWEKKIKNLEKKKKR